MKRWLTIALFLIVLMLTGCTRTQDYLDVMNAQMAAYKEMADILEKVEDAKTMTEAKSSLEERLQRCEQLARQGSALPPPSDEVKKRLEQEQFVMDRTVKRLERETRRVRQLPGGDEFFRHFESKSHTLFRAWLP